MINYSCSVRHRSYLLYNILTSGTRQAPRSIQNIVRGYLHRNGNNKTDEKHTNPNAFALSTSLQCAINNLLQKYPVDESKIQRLTGIKQSEVNAVQITDDIGNEETVAKYNIPIIPADGGPLKDTREKLPIFKHRQDILNLINANQVIVLSGATGSGKTTQVPQYILEDFGEKGKHCRVICTQPRRLATTSIAGRVSSERNDTLGKSVGYQIRLDSCVSKETNLIFTTSGFLLRLIIGKSSGEYLKNITHLIFDEVHEREDITDFLLIAIKDALKTNPHLKVILMSATLDADIFCKYFDNCPRIDIPGRMYPVDIIYLDEVLRATLYQSAAMKKYMGLSPTKKPAKRRKPQQNSPPVVIRDKKLMTEAYLKTISTSRIDHELLVSLIRSIHTTKPHDGSILVFLPGMNDILEQEEAIRRTISMEDYQLYLLHSTLNGTDRSDQERVFEKLPSGVRKIILSTNIAETSVTISDVAYVIDTGKSNQRKFHFQSQTGCLVSDWVSKAVATQRAGRAGRTQNGICYRLYSQEMYENMAEYSQPEILRVPLTEICLNSKILINQGSIEDFLLKAIEPPPAKSIKKSVDLLKRIDALDEQENLTELGIHLAKLPADAQIGKCLLYGVLLKCLDPIVTIISMLSTNYPFDVPPEQRSNVRALRRLYANGSFSDHIVKLNTYNAWERAYSQGLGKEFSLQNYLINQNMEMAKDLRTLFIRNLHGLGLIGENEDLNKHSAELSVIQACLTAGFYPNICQINSDSNRFSSDSDTFKVGRSSIVGNGQGNIQFCSNADWAVYGLKDSRKFGSEYMIDDITPINVAHLALFAGPLNFSRRHLAMVESRKVNTFFYYINGWINLVMSQQDALLIWNLRQKLSDIFVRMLTSSAKFKATPEDNEVISILVDVLKEEERKT